MSIESAKVFIEKMKTDEDFRTKVSECKDTEARKAFVAKEGFDFTVEDLKEASGLIELSGEEIENITGGNYLGCCPFDWLHIAQ